VITTVSPRERRVAGRNAASGFGRALLGVVALLAWCGVLLQLWLSAQLARASGGSALSGMMQALCYFTLLTNLLVALVSNAQLCSVSWLQQHRGLLAAAAVYILVVGIIYTLLLRDTWAPTGPQKLADVLLHDAVPLGYVLWWLAYAPKVALRWKAALWWLGYPAVYLGFSLLLGALSGRYLYPFADLSRLAASVVARNAALLLALFYLLGLAAIALARRSVHRPWPAPPEAA
jgi:hypothetical protein